MGYSTFHENLDQNQTEQEAVGTVTRAVDRRSDDETVDAQIKREIEEQLSEKAIRNRSSALTQMDYLHQKAAWIARGAAHKAAREVRQHKAEHPDFTLTLDEIETVKALRAGKAGVIPISGGSIPHLAPTTDLQIIDPMTAYLERQWDWSQRTFGPGFRTTGVLNHIRKETYEVEKKPFDLEEWVDLIILALDGFWRHGGSARRLLTILQFKQDKNIARDWPDWRERSEDQAIEHVRTEQA